MAATALEWDAAAQPPDDHILEVAGGNKLGRKPKAQPGVHPKALPLDYMLAVIRDPSAGVARRDRMAIAAAPYCHARVAYAYKGKKTAEAEAAQQAGAGTAWAGDLEFEGRAN